ncbi:uncharacterized protein OCT59_003661 [Rhizophagus irregularis]|uniref:uncharacterized protein n=1 Tax=Rhizophagus irregularis TaxID=588596 RepID=UPI003322EBA2|nr:hypothetical protein OCT59_003661 [Rhizophagus irregularis]
MSTDEFHSNQNDQQPQQPQQINQREITNQVITSFNKKNFFPVSQFHIEVLFPQHFFKIIYTCFKEAIIGIEGYIGPIKASTSPSYYRIS